MPEALKDLGRIFPFLLLALFAGVPARADQAGAGPSLCESAASDNYWTKLSGQFARGTVNTAFCWVELFHQPAEEYKNPGPNLIWGVAKGVGFTLLRAATGILEIAISPTPPQSDGTYLQVTQDCAFGLLGWENR